MQPFTTIDRVVVPVDRPNVDTDAILPKQYMKITGRTGFGPYLFDEWRYLDAGEPGDDCTGRRQNHTFALNLPRYQGAGILLGRANFGCGSSREHAVWALSEWGIRALVAPSFAEIFRDNCLKNGLLPVVLPEFVVNTLFDVVRADEGYRLAIDLVAQTVLMPDGNEHAFNIDPYNKAMLLDGLDAIGATLRHTQEIDSFERQRLAQEPWLASTGAE
ncbi:3-isopropylmalate dehydratase small subunit 1 [Paraburkholderia hiiakae]|uniref:3-isopropylmalate dehydratase small subunit n=1 Tax=Paraburkholderia hiiakae TaxID=1081782 RepID=A0ABM8P8Z5_9BURK|nr:3-isopropylmalate dehydratase small subunit [Paraburkholderia hiiakae]CAD6559477.1 3-isopropylmalate dehydratase small subunit 1 [Paraburkholderia hiiakae]